MVNRLAVVPSDASICVKLVSVRVIEIAPTSE